MDERYKFLGPNHVKQWLLGHPEGRQVLREVLSQSKRPYGDLLAVAEWDRVGIYTTHRLHVQRVTRLSCEGGSKEERALTEDLVHVQLPPRWSYLYQENFHLGDFQQECVDIGGQTCQIRHKRLEYLTL